MQQQKTAPPRIRVDADRAPTPPSRDAEPQQAAVAADRNLYLNEEPDIARRASMTVPTDDAASLASEAPGTDGAAAAAGSQPQISVPDPAAPAITIEINKVVYRIARANISVNTVEQGLADVNVSLELGAPAKHEDDSSYVKSLKTSFRSSKRAIFGAANKLFKPGKNRASVSSEFFEPAVGAAEEMEAAAATATPGHGTADQNHLPTGAAGGQNSSSDADASAGNRDTMSDVGRQRLRTASSSQENTIESDQQPKLNSGDETPVTAGNTSTKSKGAKSRNKIYKMLKKTQQQSEPVAIQFPDCVPDSLKAFFEISQSTRLVASVYAADCSSIAKDIKQDKELQIPESAERKMKFKGKSRSVWLCPTAGEKIEVWKLYYNTDNKCQKLLARLPGTDLFGYIVPCEIDLNRQFDSPADQLAYQTAIQSLALQEEIYDVEEPPLTPDVVEEDPSEIYM